MIARNTAFAYKGKHIDVKNIGRELNVHYVLEGSVQRSGNRMRVNVQLIDAERGNHLWAERFDKPVADLFDMQDEIVARIANTLNSQLIAVEARRAGRVPTPNSMDLYFQGLAWVNKGITLDNMTKARGFFERALASIPSMSTHGSARRRWTLMLGWPSSLTTGPRVWRRQKPLPLRLCPWLQSMPSPILTWV